MKKQILNLGKSLNKAEQKTINGGGGAGCLYDYECKPGHGCCFVNPHDDGVCAPPDAWCTGL